MTRRLIQSLIVASFLFLGFAGRVQALEFTSFPSCISPSGSIKSSYASGIHGIPGMSAEFSGSDAVFGLSGESALQCFCDVQGNGIQTNWQKISEVSQEEIDTYQKLDWTYIPDGSAWGLAAGPYLAKNISYSCLPSGGNGGFSDPGPGSAPVCHDTKPPAPVLLSVSRTGTTASLKWTPVTPVTHYTISYGTVPGVYEYGVPNTGNTTEFTVGSLDVNKNYYFAVQAVNGCMPSDASTAPIGGGEVLGASTGEVLGLANTGNTTVVAGLILGGLGLFSLSMVGYRRQRD